MNEKIDKYFKFLHPEYDTLTPGQQFELMDDRGFIADHIDEIDKYYEGCMREGSGAQQKKLTEQEIIVNAVRMAKVKIYDNLLHPNFDELTHEEQVKALDDRDFIADHIDEIDKYYESCMKEGSEAQQKGLTDQEIIVNAVRMVKVNMYDNVLHPNFDELTHEEQVKALDDRDFIADHIDEIDEIYTTYVSNAERRGEEIDKQKIIKSAIGRVQDLQNRDTELQKVMDTPKDIAKNEEIDSEEIIPIDESKFAQIYGKAKGRIKEVFSKIKSFLNIKSNDRSDKTNDENIK